MSLLAIARRYLVGRFVPTALTAVSIALGVALVVATVLLAHGIREGFIEGATDYNLVVGAKGSPTQLVLNVVFRMDTPTPNMPITLYEDLASDPVVDVAIPVMMGDAYRGFRYMATVERYFADAPWRRRSLALAAGRLFRDDPVDRPSYEAVVGAEAARRTGLRVGDRFAEGEELAERPLTVVGVLRSTGTADDRTVFLSLASFWEMNEVSREMALKPVTAVLVRPKRLSDLPALHRRLNVSPATQGVMPSAVLLGIFNVIGLVEDVLGVVLAIAAVVVFLSLFVSMYAATFERRREIATMRALGARRTTVFAIVLLEATATALVGAVAGILVGHGAAYLGGQFLAARGGPVVHPFAVGLLQPGMLAAVVAIGALAGLVPALIAYRTEVAENLAPL